MTRSAPQLRIRSIFSGEATVGTKIFAGMLSFCAAKATAAPWLPPEAATTPAFGIFRSSRFAKAPRALNDPECWRSSSLKTMENGARPNSPPLDSTTGVRRTRGRMIFSVARIRSRSMMWLCVVVISVLLYLGSWLIVYMNLERALQALASARRMQILDWLKNPRKHFPPQVYGDLVRDGVCGVFIARKMRVSQPTASEHLKILQQAGLVRAKRIKQWTFYRRDEAQILRIKRTISTKV